MTSPDLGSKTVSPLVQPSGKASKVCRCVASSRLEPLLRASASSLRSSSNTVL